MEEVSSINEDLDSIAANIEYVQSNIVELQNDLIAVDDTKVHIGTRGLCSLCGGTRWGGCSREGSCY